MILKYLGKKEWALVVACVVLIAVQVYLDLEIPGYMASITTILTTGGTSDEVLAEGIPMLACALGSLASSVIVGAMAAYVAVTLAKNLRKKQFDSVQKFSFEEIGRFSIASLITRSTNDVNQIQMVVAMGLQVMVKAPIMAVWAVYKILGSDLRWTWSVAISVVVMLAVILVIMRFVTPKFKKIQSMTDDVNRVTKEGIEGIRVVRAYNAEDFQEDRFKSANKTLTDTHLSVTRALAFLSPAMTSVMNLMSLSIYWVGASVVNEAVGLMRIEEFSSMVVFSAYALQVVGAFMLLTMIFMILPRAQVAARRIEEVIDTKPSIVDGGTKESPAGHEGEIEFRNVGFSYPDTKDYVFSDIDLKVSKGETIAFIGATGSGKSTLINLIPRFYDATEGQVLVDGVDVREYDLDALRRKIGYVPQKAVLMSGTVESNVNYGNTSDERDMDDVKHAVRIAQGTDFIEKMENGYEGRVAENGSNFSGGQKQRLSIARAVCRKPEIYVFDDSFSALDYRTDLKLRTALRKEISDATLIIVAQRIGTIRDADKIVVLDSGKAVGIGTHEELMKTCEVYREIASSQLTAEEAAL
ncbi:MAG: ABC transporter ATP-binding protein [Candidatus Methanomethylophilaceae archaeon]|nr:ABC transporter ATP-binding protein [Candidatus Methanomethylophilaceae archaeon]